MQWLPFLNLTAILAMKLDPNPRKRKSLETVRWIIHDSCLMGNWREALPCNKIAAFDFDGTLCGNLGNYVYPKHEDDWKWVHPIIPHVLASLHKNGYQIIILSNQKGILAENRNAKRRKSIFQARIGHIINSLENETGLQIPIRILAAATDDIYRKGMWQVALDRWVDQYSQIQDCFYCGDAAGRSNDWINGFSKEDFADTDHKFAINAKMRFFVPEQIFHQDALKDEGEKDPYLNLKLASLPKVPFPKHPKTEIQDLDYEIRWEIPNFQELVLFVGPPAAGKTFFYQRYMSQYVHINQDTLKSREKCLKKASEALDHGQSVVIDNTNPDMKSRQAYIKLAKERNVPIRCMLFEVPREICRHNNFYRVFHRDERRAPSIAANVFFSKFEEPSIDEGYKEIIRQKWCPTFASEEEKSAWELYYF